MLGSLCTLLTALSCVSCVSVVTQMPPVLSVSAGQTATLDCNIGTVDSWVRWYKQSPGSSPEFVLYFHISLSAPTYGPGFSSSRFTSKCQSNTDCQLILSNVEAGDLGVYYCNVHDKPAQAWVFGQGTKLIVTDQTLPAPSLTLHRPSTQELDKGEATLVCLASKMSVGYADVSWTANGSPVTTGVVTSPASVQDDGTFSLSSFLSVSAADWDSDRSYSCTVSQGGSASASRQVKKSQCLL
ncbi:immunoglobulin lambda-1 light chain [Amia ocellicauda]|uniref:immunoglobulin lambda-1 light chain n=1 Tax=Amia ocellicauda TaxID=2972642 RepID=UPI00346411BC|nr:IGLL5 protein [Amia calva]